MFDQSKDMGLVFFGLLLHLAHTYSIDTILLTGSVEWNNIPTTHTGPPLFVFFFLPFHLISYLIEVVTKKYYLILQKWANG